jgi:hypothetical protein
MLTLGMAPLSSITKRPTFGKKPPPGCVDKEFAEPKTFDAALIPVRYVDA